MKTKISVALIAILTILYVVLVGSRAVLLIGTGEPVGVAMGIVLIIFPLVALWAIGRELWFGYRSEQVLRRLEREGREPTEVVGVSASGKPARDEADALFPAYRDAAERAGDEWYDWVRLALVYDGAGDRRRARESMRKGISMERQSRRGEPHDTAEISEARR